ncbi:hypothetical protein ACQ4PT_004434 [Festuca glaucescens]
METLPSSPRHPPKYGSAAVQNALEQLASIDLIELSKEARIEHCRAARDLSSCGRYVQHVLDSCGHASLCAECSQRCDVCPICRSPIPDNGNRVRLRLYHKCLEAGLISKQHDESAFFFPSVTLTFRPDITDVCLDESAVSSDPLLAFLLDEVVIKDWCKRAVNALISEICTIYKSGLEMMKSKLPQLQKFAVQLAGISSVVEAMIASFREAAHVNDLHQLIENTMKAKQEACSLLPKISSKETHPKIAQVLLERHKPDVALVVLKCTGGDSFSTTANIEKDGLLCLTEAVTALRIRIEYGHVTEAFMFHRSYCSRVKEQRSADTAHVEDAHRNSWMYHVEVMMAEFCEICIDRNVVDKIIDLPWDSEEEKHLHKSLFDSARERPTGPCGSLLVVFYLQAKCLEMLPEVQREAARAISSGDQSQFAIRTMQMSSPVNPSVKSPKPAIGLSSSFTPALQNKPNPLQPKNIHAATDSGARTSSIRSEFERKVPSILQCRPVPPGTPTSNMRSNAGIMFPSVGQNGENPYLKGTKELGFMKGESGFKKGTKPAGHDSLPMYFNLGAGDTPMKTQGPSLSKTERSKTTTFFQGKDSVRKGEFDFGLRAEKPFILSGTNACQNGHTKVSDGAGFREGRMDRTKVPATPNIFR